MIDLSQAFELLESAQTLEDLRAISRLLSADQLLLAASLSNGADKVRFDRWIAHDQLWFAHSGNDLVVSVIGQNQSGTVTNWYTSNDSHLGSVLSGDGHVVSDAGIQQLVEAMASFTPPPASGQTTLPPELAANLAPALSANWQHQ
jgi:hypothetical protein